MLYVRRGGVDAVTRKISRILRGCGYFLVPLRRGFVAVRTRTASLPRLADTKKYPATGPECIFVVGSSSESNQSTYLEYFEVKQLRRNLGVLSPKAKYF